LGAACQALALVNPPAGAAQLIFQMVLKRLDAADVQQKGWLLDGCAGP